MHEHEIEVAKSTRTIVIHPCFNDDARSSDYALEEAVGLTAAIDLDVVYSTNVTIRAPKPDRLIGKGKVDELGNIIRENNIKLAFVDSRLSPVQQRNLEQDWKCKVIDRSGLILEIFGARARTSEGKLQVELAALEYQKSRLVRSWTHLERQRGGFGFLGGPGETQIELDKRMINTRIIKIKKELEKVVRTRTLHRKPRQEVPYKVVALVGYTNAGKSTLFNRLTNANVLAEDKLFATLDPTMRILKLPSGRKVILSDTVGFISELPTELIAAFRATLEEVVESDIILHIRDISHPETELQKANVEDVLRGLGMEDKMRDNAFEVLNKVDLMDRTPHGMAISALTGKGVDTLLNWIDEKLQDSTKLKTYKIPTSEGAALAWLYRNADVVTSKTTKTNNIITVKILDENAQRFSKLFPIKN